MSEKSEHDDFIEDDLQETECGYFPDRKSYDRLLLIPSDDVFVAELLGKNVENPCLSLFDSMLSSGYRRSGGIAYKAVCPGCGRCVPIRIRPEKFVFSKKHRHLLRRNCDIEIKIVRSAEELITPEKIDLMARYNLRHNPSDNLDRRGVIEILENINGICDGEVMYKGTVNFDYRAGGKLVGVGVIDFGAVSVSSCYFYYDTSHEVMKRSLGTFSILKEIEYCALNGYKFYYLGYYISKCKAMSYKGRFLPHELLVGGEWQEQVVQNMHI